MMPDPLFYQLLLVGLVWLCLMLHVVWPSDRATASPTTPRPAKAPPQRSSARMPAATWRWLSWVVPSLVEVSVRKSQMHTT